MSLRAPSCLSILRLIAALLLSSSPLAATPPNLTDELPLATARPFALAADQPQIPSDLQAQLLKIRSSALEMDNEDAKACVDAATLAFLAFYPGSLTWGPSEMIGEIGTYTLNLALKFCAGELIPPETVERSPNLRNAEGELCYWEAAAPVTEGVYENILGIVVPPELIPEGWGTPFARNWGALGTPDAYHFNSQVEVTLSPPGEIEGGRLRVPVGNNYAEWRAATKLSLLDLVFLPIPGPFDDNDIPKKRILWNLAKKIASGTLEDIAESYGLSRLEDASGLPISWDSALNTQFQKVVVFDDVPPTIELDTTYVELIATDPGGAKRRNHERDLFAMVHARDACDRPVRVNFRDMPEFFEVDREYLVTWIASDRGPRSTGGFNRTEQQMTIVARDIYPPDIQAPDHQVVLSSQSAVAVDLGHPQVFDAVDLEPRVVNDAPQLFPQGVTVVHWQAIDQSNNRSEVVEQRIHVKPSNEPPLANDRTGADRLATKTFAETEIVLEGWDPDPKDHLNFEISSAPENGFFHAPLYPAFVEDYRVEAAESFDQLETRCDTQSGPFQFEAPFAASFVAVADDGTTFVIDQGDMYCQFGNLDTNGRIAVFDADGKLKRRPDGGFASISYDPAPRGIWIDQRAGLIYVTDHTSGGTATVNVFDTDLVKQLRLRIDDAEIPSGENVLSSPLHAVADHDRGILYVADFHTIRAYRSDRIVAGGLADEPVLLGSILRHIAGNNIADLEVDSAGNLYVALRASDRVLKFSASTFDSAGRFVPGEPVGWMGRCDQETGPPLFDEHGQRVLRCDLERRRSLGFRCTDETCAAEQSWGAAKGQFDEPRGLAMSPDDVLYVTDYNNFRIQRFTPDGFFAGEAKSTCDGVCFVLGAFNKPEDVTVNSHHFYLLDRETDLLHVSETTPIELIDGRSAFVTYQSDDRFTGIDRFRFRTDDGLERSDEATVEIQVSRNQRPPKVGADLVVVTDEDQAVEIALTGFDPDGDPLRSVIVDAPENGVVSGAGSRVTYRPERDWVGEDTFTYTLRDDVATAADTATVTIQVRPRPDRPSVEIPSAASAGAGFPFHLDASFADPDRGDRHTIVVDWGDGTVLSEQPIADAESGDGPFLTQRLTGGEVVGSHTYARSGRYSVEVCVTDGEGEPQAGPPLEGCDRLSVEVRPLVDVAVVNSLQDRIQAEGLDWQSGLRLEYTLTVANRRPEGSAGLTATGLVLEDLLGPDVTLESVRSDNGSCRAAGQGLRCELFDLAPGAEAIVAVAVTLGTPNNGLISAAEARAREEDALPGNNGQQVEVPVAGGAGEPGPGPQPQPGCEPGGLCLGGGRFRVEVAWRDFDGNRGAGTPVPGSDDSGLFWFFDQTNWEMLVKVLDACSFNGHFWVLAAATTDVEYTLTVQDTATGEVATYRNGLGDASPAIIDSEALDTCSASSGRTIDRAAAARRFELEMSTLEARLRTAQEAQSTCPGGAGLCLADGRFRIEVDWRNRQGASGTAQVVPFGSADSGLFWFFDPDNWEMLVKILDGCAINGNYWVFSAATTDVEYTLRVTDTPTGQVRTYRNAQGNAAAALTDTTAFATCSAR